MTEQQRCKADVALGDRPGVFAGGPSVCGRVAAAVVEYGCVHEHLGREAVCGEHRDLMLSGRTACARCWEGPPVSRHAPHPCQLLGRVTEVLPAGVTS